MLWGTPIDISDEMLSVGIGVLLFVIEKFAIPVVSRSFKSNDGWATVSVGTVHVWYTREFPAET